MHLHHSIPYLHSSKFSHTFPLPQIHQLNSVSPPKRADLPGMSPNMTQQHAVRRGTNPHIKAELSQEQAKESGTPLFPFSGVPQKHQANNHSMHAEDLAQTHADSMTATSVSLSPTSLSEYLLMPKRLECSSKGSKPVLARSCVEVVLGNGAPQSVFRGQCSVLALSWAV